MIIIKSADKKEHADISKQITREDGSCYYLNFFFRQDSIMKMLWGQV